MDNQDQRRTHTLGHESHGVHVCHKCGWSFPNPHPSAKHRRAHKKICGTIEGYKLCVAEGQNRLNGSDDEHVSDDDHKTPGPNTLDTGNNEKGNDGNGEILIRSEDEVFSDAVADFSDSGLNPGIKERLQEGSLDSGTNVESVDIKDPKFSRSSEDNGFNAADVSQLNVKSSDDVQIQNHKIVQSESVDMGNTVELQCQLSDSIVDPISSSVADLGTGESTIVDSDDFFVLSSDSYPSKTELMPDELPEKNFRAGENVTDCSLISVAKETILKGKEEIKSDRDVVEIVDSSDNIVGETCEGTSKRAVTDEISLDHQVGHGAVNLKEKNGAEFLSLLPQDDPLELNSVVITNDALEESAHVVEFTTSSDVKILQEKEEGHVNVDQLPACDDRPDVAHPQTEYGDIKDHEGVASQSPLSLHSSDSLKHEEDDLKTTVNMENIFHFNTSQLNEKGGVLSPDMHVMDSNMKKGLVNSEPMAEEMHAEQYTEVSPFKLTVESYQGSNEIGVSMNAMKTEMNENHMVHFSEEQAPDDVRKNSQQISLPEVSLMSSSNDSQRNASFGSATSETTSVIIIDNISHHEENINEINDVTVDVEDVGGNVENDIEIILKDLHPSDLLQSEVKQSSDSFKSEDAGEMSKIEQCDIIDAQCRERPIVRDTSSPNTASSQFESPVISEVVLDGPGRKSKGTECTKVETLSGAQEDIKEDEINTNIKLNEECSRSVGTSADSLQAQEEELLVKAAEDPARKYTSLSSLNTEPSAQHDSAAEDHPGGEPGRDGITTVPVQDQSGNNLVKYSSSGIDASLDSGSRCDSLEGNWGSVSVLSMLSDAPAVIDAEALPSTGLLASTEAGKSNLNNLKATSEKQQFGKSEMFEQPSFMTLIEPRPMVSPKAAASEAQEGQNSRQPYSSTSQAGWFPTLTQVMNESQGRKKSEEIIAKVTNWSTSKEHTPLKSLLGEAAHSNKAKSPKMEENSVNQKNGKVPENNGSGLTTVNSILCPESPAAQVVKGDAAKEWDSPARYPADIKREKRKVKSRPFWIHLVCCSVVDPQRR
ncbi:uncharacterized protein LOC133307292 [Gastrolobium bilobum]|uniref:uncharacterized protein LOC133307292 n=1 Tax=Gastrolobium bilobum TaxID=150636 RepID=UPI002AB02A49|nr:uncharacterized protein LOC133307292 [Gastrolobium bilobum]